jgi:2-oxoglutarate dehydrogenase complex dehydrogenase (E1) component-like enzyme
LKEENPLSSLTLTIESAAEQGVEHLVWEWQRGRLNCRANIFGKSTQDILVSLMVKITIKNILMEM